jgi:hypothetical protein
MEFKGTRESKIEEIKLRVKGVESVVTVNKFDEVISSIDVKTEVSSEEMQFLMLENSRQMLNIAKVFLWVCIILPVVILGLNFILNK